MEKECKGQQRKVWLELPLERFSSWESRPREEDKVMRQHEDKKQFFFSFNILNPVGLRSPCDLIIIPASAPPLFFRCTYAQKGGIIYAYDVSLKGPFGPS